MQVESGIMQLLGTSSEIAQQVADRIYPGEAPQTAVYPYIVWGVASKQPDISHQGRTGCDRYVIDVQCIAREYLQAKSIAAAVEKALDPNVAMPSGIGAILYESEFDQAEFTGSGADERIRTVVQQYIVWAG